MKTATIERFNNNNLYLWSTFKNKVYKVMNNISIK